MYLVVTLIVGISKSILWQAEAVYIAECTGSRQKGKYFGIFWGIFQLTQFFGNLESLVIIESLGTMNYYLIMTL